MRLDGELIRRDGAAINWRELRTGTGEILVKTLGGVALLDRSQLSSRGDPIMTTVPARARRAIPRFRETENAAPAGVGGDREQWPPTLFCSSWKPGPSRGW